MQHRITEPGPLLDSRGHLVEEGWASSLIKTYSREAVKASALRKKEWDYYYILDQDKEIFLTFTISDLGYIGLSALAWIDFKSGKFSQTDEMSILPLGKTGLPPDSSSGTVSYKGKKLSIHYDVSGGVRKITAQAPALTAPDGGTGFSCDLILTENPKDDSMVIATSWRENRKAFYYNQKINNMTVSGKARLGSAEYIFNPENSFGGLDWGRGFWTYKNRWFWSSASGKIGKDIFGFNLGYGFSDRTPASENMLFFNGRAHKLGEVLFSYNPENYNAPWKISDNENRLLLDFVPRVDRNSRTDLGIIKSVQHQVFGLFSGEAVLDSGDRIKIKDFPGFAEDVLNWW